MVTVLTVAVRYTAFASMVVAVYIVVGSWMFPSWWHGLFFSREERSFRNVRDGLRYVLYSGLAFKIVVAFLAAILLGAAFRHWLFPLTDRFAGRIIFISFVAIVVDAFLLYLDQKLPAQRVRATADSLTRAMDAFMKLGPPAIRPKIESLVFFHYLDDARVEGLYSQIQPKWQESEYTQGDSSALRGEARVGHRVVGVGGKVEQASESKVTYVRSELSVEQKCVLLMKYVMATWAGNYYTTDLHWYSNRGWRGIEDKWKEAYSRRRVDYRKLEGAAAQWQVELKSELESLRGRMVFVNGEFEVSSRRDDLALLKTFSTSPFSSSFRILLSEKAWKIPVPTTRSLSLTVFGNVRKPLGEDGFVEIVAIAAF
jgi:hypothetical protein